MPLKYHPEPGTILICDFPKDCREPEMVKRRPVVVLSPRLKRRHGLITVVPMSTTAPRHVTEYHHQLRFDPPLPAPYDSPICWVKGDMLFTVGFDRLNLVRTGRDHEGKRKYLTLQLDRATLTEIHRCVLMGLGLPGLTTYLG